MAARAKGGLALLLLLWVPWHFAAQGLPPVLEVGRRLLAGEEVRSDSQRSLQGHPFHHPVFSGYLRLFGVVQAYGFFADTSERSIRFRVTPAEESGAPGEPGGPRELHFPPEAWTPYDYGSFQLRLFEALAFDDDKARSYLGRQGCARWPGTSGVVIERLAGEDVTRRLVHARGE
jgi:hypothetical protein